MNAEINTQVSHFNLMRKSARQYSSTFLLLGSIACASPLYAGPQHEVQHHNAFLPIFTAEYALSQDNITQAIEIYLKLVEKYNLPNINERALDISLRYQDIESALQIAQLWTARYPDDVPARFYLAHLALRAQNYALAAKTLEKILQSDPNADLEGILAGIYPESAQARAALLSALYQLNQRNNPSILVMIAGLEAQNGQYQTALKKVNAALRKKPNVPSFVILKANLLFASGETKKALKWLSRAERQQKSADVGLFEVQHLIRIQQAEQALKKLTQLNKKWPKNEQVLFLAGITSIDLKQYERAESFLEQLLHSELYQDQAYYYLAVNAERKEDWNTALILLNDVDGNLYTVSRKKMVSIFLNQQRAGDAIRFLTQERVSHPHQASFLYQLQAQILQQYYHKAQAIRLLDEAIQQMPDDPELIYAQVLLLDPYVDRVRLDNALQKLLEIEPNSPTFLNAYAYTLALQNRNLDRARQYAEQALSYAPQQSSILDTLGYIAFLQNDIEVAVKALAEAYHLSPSLNIGLRYAKALYLHGDLALFTEITNQLQQHYPDSSDVEQLSKLLVPIQSDKAM